MNPTLLVFILLYTAVCEAQQNMATKKVTIKRISQCYGMKNLSVVLENVVIGREKEFQAISSQATVRQDLSENVYLLVDVRKCVPGGSPDSCEYIVKGYNHTKICDLLSGHGEAWSEFIENSDLNKCPIKMGKYTMSKTIIGNRLTDVAPFSNAIWKLQYSGYDHNLNILCIEIELAVKLIHARNNNNSRGRRQ